MSFFTDCRYRPSCMCLIVSLVCTCCLLSLVSVNASDVPCSQSDIDYVYSECQNSLNSDSYRWKVPILKEGSDCLYSGLMPVKSMGCDKVCPAGQYLDLFTEMCLNCEAGTYSLGGGVRFDEWYTLPPGFTVAKEKYNNAASSRNCDSDWIPDGKYITFLPDLCLTTLQYTANLLRPGKVQFIYQHVLRRSAFFFKLTTSECIDDEDSSSHVMLNVTKSQWELIEFNLPAGLNKLQWTAFSAKNSEISSTQAIRIKSITITGVNNSYTCIKCRAGTWSSESSAECKECPANTYSEAGSSVCSPCETESEYSAAGSSKCKKRPECRELDYFQTVSECDNLNQFQIKYNWTEPFICQPTSVNIQQLNEQADKKECPFCSPGMERRLGNCFFCEDGTYSDGKNKRCAPCALSTTVPIKEVVIDSWIGIGKAVNVSSFCVSLLDDNDCLQSKWYPQRDHIYAFGLDENVMTVLTLTIGGFRGISTFKDGKPEPIADISFDFELNCLDDCSFFFLYVQENGNDLITAGYWNDTSSRQTYKLSINETSAIKFMWVFQGASSNENVKLFKLRVSNTLQGGAVGCRKCEPYECVTCQPGHYFDVNGTCHKCPPNTFLSQLGKPGIQSCAPCSSGFESSSDGTSCQPSCTFISKSNKFYDLTPLSGFQSINDVSSNSVSKGQNNYRVFNISLCGGEKNHFALATCFGNMSDLSDRTTSQVSSRIWGRANDSDGEWEEVNKPSSVIMDQIELVAAPICAFTIFPGKTIYAANPTRFGSVLTLVTDEMPSVTEIERAEGWNTSNMSIYFTYYTKSNEMCPDGQKTIIILHCNQSQPGTGTIKLRGTCSGESCDKCTLFLLWSSEFACPICSENDLAHIKEECVDGEQKILVKAPSTCQIPKDMPKITMRKCSLLPSWTIPIMIAITVILITSFGLILHCWIKNRRLEYSYTKLIAEGNNGEMPEAETCALDEGEEEELDMAKLRTSKGKGKRFSARSFGKWGKNSDVVLTFDNTPLM